MVKGLENISLNKDIQQSETQENMLSNTDHHVTEDQNPSDNTR